MNNRIQDVPQIPSRSRSGAERESTPDAEQKAALLRLLQLEADIRRVATQRELAYHIANESRAVLGFRQAFVFRKRRRWSLEAVSSVSTFDRHAQLNVQITKFVTALSRKPGGDAVMRSTFGEGSAPGVLTGHMFQHMVWMPLKTRKGKVFGGITILHERAWPESFLPLAERVAGAYAFAWESMSGRALVRRRFLPARIVVPAVLLGLVALGFVRAPLTVLAPAEVTGQDRIVVAAPLNGAIERIAVSPNERVAPGALLAEFDDTELRNAFEIAEKRVIVAAAELEKMQNASFVEREAARQIKIAEAELALAEAERQLAQERLARVEILADGDGIVIFDDPRDLTGRPVSVGEPIMEIVSPELLEFTVRLPVRDSIILEDGNRVRVFLDSDPLRPIEAVLERRSYRATAEEDGSFAYTLVARAEAGELEGIRIGTRGTAQIFGEMHPLHFIVFRRPLSWLRQTLGY